MKKVALSLAVLFAAALVSCGNKENKAEEAAIDSTATEVVDTTVAPATDSAAAPVAADTAAPAAQADSVQK